MQDDPSAVASFIPDLEPASVAETATAASRGALVILVVDDDHVVGRMMADGLAAMGYAVVLAHSADEAKVQLQTRHDIGVVVSDIRMPGRDGLALALDVTAKLEDARAASTVLVTGHATIKEVDAAIRLGIVEFLRKPCRLRELVDAVERGLETARKHRGIARRNIGLG